MEEVTKEDDKFLSNPNLKITYGINNKKEYFESDTIYDYLEKKNKAITQAKLKELRDLTRYIIENQEGWTLVTFHKELNIYLRSRVSKLAKLQEE